MAKQKLQRNEAIWKDLQGGMSRKELCQKYKMTMSCLKSQIGRIRERKHLFKEGIIKDQVSKSPQVDKSISPLVHKRATYYLSPEIVRKIKEIALSRDIDRSELVRKILSEWISEQVDL